MPTAVDGSGPVLLRTTSSSDSLAMADSQPPPTRPPRRPATTTLWAHLARKDTRSTSQSAEPAAASYPLPSHPIDKAGTSTRILLLDTQQNMEKFSERVEKAILKLEEARLDVQAMQKAAGDLREETVSVMSDLGASYLLGICAKYIAVQLLLTHKIQLLEASRCLRPL